MVHHQAPIFQLNRGRLFGVQHFQTILGRAHERLQGMDCRCVGNETDGRRDRVPHESVWGFFLARNVESLEQVSELTAHMRDLTDAVQTPVSSIRKVAAQRPPPAACAELALSLGSGRDLRATARQAWCAAWFYARLHAFDLLRVGVNVDCLPVLDVPVEGAHDVIGARAYLQESMR